MVKAEPGAPGRRSLGLRRAAPFLTALTLFVALAALYLFGTATAYHDTILNWGIEPFHTPFVDTDTVLSAVRCARAGVDVYAVNPCDPLGRVYDYSPLWLLLTYLPVTAAWVQPVGLVVDGAFMLSLLLLPAGRTGRDVAFISIGAVSSACVFAVERGNNDLVLFALAAIAAASMAHSRGIRLVGYSAALLAGLLKYYPMTLMALAVREKPRLFLAIAVAAALAVALFVVVAGHDLVRALHLIPTGLYFGDMFGSVTLAGGLSQIFGWSASARSLVHLALSLLALATGMAIAAKPQLRDDLRRLAEPEKAFLLAGSLLVLSCFFTAQNIGYRAVHLLLLLPPLTALHRAGGWRRSYSLCAAAAFILLWAEGWRRIVALLSLDLAPASLRPVSFACWLLREALWWGLVTMLIAFVAASLFDSEMGRFVVTRAGRLAGRDSKAEPAPIGPS